MALQPFDSSRVESDAVGIKHYTGLTSSVLAMLRLSVDRDPNAHAVVELNGPQVSYRKLWDRSARVAGGLRAARLPCRSIPASPTPRSMTS